jgi:dTDP-4-dehydrorhamnose 3,5-epimerase-like enzyme
LYFEADARDGFREPWFSRERRLEPQITIEVLTDASGFPLMVHAFAGSTAETTTIVPAIRAFAAAHQLPDVTGLHTITAADPVPDALREAPTRINNASQGAHWPDRSRDDHASCRSLSWLRAIRVGFQPMRSGMADSGLKVTILYDSGDDRGSSFPAPDECFAGGFTVRNVHLSTLLPGYVRGNHFHVARHEALMVMSADRWSLHWDSGIGSPVEARSFDGPGAVVIHVPPHASHAIRNDGSAPLHIIGLADGPYDPDAPDAFPRQVT